MPNINQCQNITGLGKQVCHNMYMSNKIVIGMYWSFDGQHSIMSYNGLRFCENKKELNEAIVDITQWLNAHKEGEICSH